MSCGWTPPRLYVTTAAMTIVDTSPLVSLSQVSLERGGRSVLEGVDLTVAPAEIVTLIGPNGAGKSSLVGLIVGALNATQGTVHRRRGLRIGYVPQRLRVDASLPLTAGRFLSLPERRSPRARAGVLAAVGLAADVAAQPLAGLSGGQFQRVLLARALLAEPELLVLDEAAQGLDPAGTAAFYALVAEQRARLGCAVLMVSHDLHVVMAAADRVVCLNGHVCCEGAPQAVASAPAYRALFGTTPSGALALYRHDHDHSHDTPAASRP